MSTSPIDMWIFVLLIRGILIAAAWLLVGGLMRKLSAGRASAWWRAGALALILVTFLPPDLALLRIAFPTPAPAAPLASVVSTAKSSPAEVETTLPPLPVLLAHPQLAWWVWVWLAGTFVLGGRLLLSQRRVAALVRAARTVQNPSIAALLPKDVGDGEGRTRVTLKVHPGITTPFASGLLRRVIVLPERDLSHPEHLGMMLSHEWAHLRRGDLLSQFLGEIAVVLHWPNPLAWLLKSRLRFVQEAAADDEVLSGGCDGPSYATLLLHSAASECRLAREVALLPMARASTLRRRIGLLLDPSRNRALAHPVLRWLMLGVAGLAAGTLGFRELRAEPKSDLSQNWSRQYRDTLRLEKSFAERFDGSSTEAALELRREVIANRVLLRDSVELSLSTDKSTLVVGFSEEDRPIVEDMFQVLSRAGWWHDPRRKSTDAELAPQRERLNQAAVEMARLRAAGDIIDPDPESFDAIISFADERLVKAERSVREQTERVSKFQTQATMLQQLKSPDIPTALRILEADLPPLRKAYNSLQDAIVERAKLTAGGAAETDSQVVAVQSQIDSFEKTLTDAIASLRANHAALVEVEKRPLVLAQQHLAEASKMKVADKVRVAEYIDVKTRYLQAKKIYEFQEDKVILDR